MLTVREYLPLKTLLFVFLAILSAKRSVPEQNFPFNEDVSSASSVTTFISTTDGAGGRIDGTPETTTTEYSASSPFSVPHLHSQDPLEPINHPHDHHHINADVSAEGSGDESVSQPNDTHDVTPLHSLEAGRSEFQEEEDNGTYIKPLYGVLVLQTQKPSDNDSSREDICFVHFNQGNLPEDRKNLVFYRVVLLSSSLDICHVNTESVIDEQLYKNSIVVVKYETTYCDFQTQAARIEERGGDGIIAQLNRNQRLKDIHVSINETSNLNKSFILGVVSEKYINLMSILNESIEDPHQALAAFSPISSESTLSSHPFDYSLVVIWFLAVFTVTGGSYWSGKVRCHLFIQRSMEAAAELEDGRRESEDSSRKRKSSVEEEPYLNISIGYVVVFVVCMALMLLSLWFFYTYLVYIIIGLFVMASILSTYVCVEPVVKKILPRIITSMYLPCCCKSRMAVYQVLVLSLSLSLAFSWFFTRKQNFSWILQDVCGVFFCLNMLRTIRLPSFKIVFVLLSLLFVYDIFFVFITPALTKNGGSIMVEVATGGSGSGKKGDAGPGDSQSNGDAGEKLPMLVKVPHWIPVNASDPLEVCYARQRVDSYSLLGFGDILVPGLLVSYCHAFDLIHGIRGKPYFITTTIFYGLGLIATFASLYLMEGTAQPALLYLVPFTIIPTLLIACCRREVKLLWKGPGDGSLKEESAASTPSSSPSRRNNNAGDDRLLPGDETTAIDAEENQDSQWTYCCIL